ncbi:hypothetical protein A0256_22845 [Mucilaginibacter sp. PAMC 26640]|nr:hypothetical protein A0256_22845 [Mucilaginibacter sp. PAMC 26640]
MYSNGGGNRILRRLFKGREKEVISLVVEEKPLMGQHGTIEETIVYASPTVRKWARWKVRKWLTWLRHGVFKSNTINKIRQAASKIDYDVLHVVDHGPFGAALCTDEFCINKEVWVSFHDHFSTTFGSYANSNALWKRATRRLVISEELGNEYSRLFGAAEFELITDGVAAAELSTPAKGHTSPMVVYFAGLLHIDYIPLFRILADALDLLRKDGHQFKLVLRGTQYIPFLENRTFDTEYRQVSIDDAELKSELDSSTMLYLPIKFTRPDFYLYSLSTKMIGYLGASGAILYHGPANAAAAKLLRSANAAVCCGEKDVEKLSKDILNLIADKSSISENAKMLARQKFDLEHIQQQFWQYKGLTTP